MSEQKMMTPADYLASEAAREDVKALLADFPAREVKQPDGRIWYKPAGTASRRVVAGFKVDTMLSLAPADAWHRVGIAQRDARLIGAMVGCVAAHYRLDGERYTVTDMGEGYRAFRLRTGGTYAAVEENDMRKNACVALGGDGGVIVHPCGGAMELAFVKDADLPDAICRVMLASLKVAQS